MRIMNRFYQKEGKKMKENKKTLYVGAHSDDVSIGASVAISRNPKQSCVLTVSNGVTVNQEFPLFLYGLTFRDFSEYSNARLRDDIRAFQLLGIDSNNFFNGYMPAQKLHLYYGEILKLIEGVVEGRGIERVVTHSFPEAHPDHEVVSLCSHLVAQKKGIPVWEYPLYVINSGGERLDQRFLDGDFSRDFQVDFSPTEFELRGKVLECYETQQFILKRFGGKNRESFRLVRRDLENLPLGTGYYYGDEKGAPTAEDIRGSFRSFLKEIRTRAT